jgi:hypothetical protein
MKELIKFIRSQYQKMFYDSQNHFTGDWQRRELKKQIHQIRLAATCEMLGAMHSYQGTISQSVIPYGTTSQAKLMFAVADDLARSLQVI